MKLQAYSIFDRMAGAFNMPFFQQNDMLAARIFKNMGEDPQTMIGKNPEDFSLHHIGEFDDEEGTIRGDEARGQLITGKENGDA